MVKLHYYEERPPLLSARRPVSPVPIQQPRPGQLASSRFQRSQRRHGAVCCCSSPCSLTLFLQCLLLLFFVVCSRKVRSRGYFTARPAPADALPRDNLPLLRRHAAAGLSRGGGGGNNLQRTLAVFGDAVAAARGRP